MYNKLKYSTFFLNPCEAFFLYSQPFFKYKKKQAKIKKQSTYTCYSKSNVIIFSSFQKLSF